MILILEIIIIKDTISVIAFGDPLYHILLWFVHIGAT